MLEIKRNLRKWLRSQPAWVRFREISAEGLGAAYRRRSIQRRILQTPPVKTSSSGKVEVRVLTWRRDWLNVLWSLKSFYRFSGVDYPLYLHDGGLEPAHTAELLRHFPNATMINASRADEVVDPILKAQGLDRCLECRRRSVMARKFFDFYLPSGAERILGIDSDILFFAKPIDLVDDNPPRQNRYNRDRETCYSLPVEELEKLTGMTIPRRINAGLSVVWRESIDLPRLEEWLAYPGMMDSAWLVEQTLHALIGARYGVDMLPASYLVSTTPGCPKELVAKHYPGFFRPLLYSEGMCTLETRGFLQRY